MESESFEGLELKHLMYLYQLLQHYCESYLNLLLINLCIITNP